MLRLLVLPSLFAFVSSSALLPESNPGTYDANHQIKPRYRRAGDPWTSPCDQGKPLYGTAACDATKTLDERADALVALLTNDQKVSILSNTAASVSSLGIPAYQWWNEALHGVGGSPGVTFAPPTPVATSFPQVIATSTSFNTTLFQLIGSAVGTEARAFHNLGHAGLTFWAPNINIFRDPRWGRGHETPGEDPNLSSDYAGHFPYGMQSGDQWPHYIKASSCCKHYAAYSLENWGGVDRHHFDAVTSEQDLQDTYFPAFQSCVQRSHASGIMCSYNAVNGIPSCARYDMLTSQLRDSWGFDGYVTSDCGAVDDVYYTHKYAPTTDLTCIDTLTAGMDSDCGGFLTSNLGSCLSRGVCNSSVTDPALHHLFRVQLRLGMYEPSSTAPYKDLGVQDINSPDHQQLALEAARQSIVLLKNEHRLPLSYSNFFAVIGPNANASVTMQGNYYGTPPYLITPFQALYESATAAVYAKGCDVACTNTDGFAEAVKLAQKADLSVVVVGLDMSQENEGLDRTSIALPGHQQDLIDAICNASSTPITLVVMSGGSVDLSAAKANPCVGALVWVGYPGQSGGQALAEVLLGFVNPSGRLTQTIYPKDFANQVSMFDMGMRPNKTSGNPGRTHRFYTGQPVYAFGDGLSYSKFTYSFSKNLETSTLNAADVRLKISSMANDAAAGLETLVTLPLQVCNSKEMAGDHVILAFSSPPEAGKGGVPLQQLAAYTRIHVDAGVCVDVGLDIPVRAFAFANESGQLTTQDGVWNVRIGQPGQLTHSIQLA